MRYASILGLLTAVGVGIIAGPASEAPSLISAMPKGIRVKLVWSHPTARDFDVREVYDTFGTNLSHVHMGNYGKEYSYHPKMLGDTNRFDIRVAIPGPGAGTSDWSNAIFVIP